MTRQGLFIHVAVSHLRRPTGGLASDKMKTAFTRTNALPITGKISTITLASTFFTALGSTNAAATDGPSQAQKYKTP
jgi:hypothetical protein